MSRMFRTDSGGYIPREFHTDAPSDETAGNEAEAARKAMRGELRGEASAKREDGEGSDYDRELATLVRKYREDHGEEPNEAE